MSFSVSRFGDWLDGCYQTCSRSAALAKFSIRTDPGLFIYSSIVRELSISIHRRDGQITHRIVIADNDRISIPRTKNANENAKDGKRRGYDNERYVSALINNHHSRGRRFSKSNGAALTARNFDHVNNSLAPSGIQSVLTCRVFIIVESNEENERRARHPATRNFHSPLSLAPLSAF